MSHPGLSLIVAMDRNRVIGRDGALPWHLPDDLKRFRKLTLGNPIIMGRRTHDSIGRPLPGRRNLVLSRDPGFRAPGCEVFASLDAALCALPAAAPAAVIGGAALYREALPLAQILYLTLVEADVDGDVHFPDFDTNAWHETAREQHAADERHAYPFSFVELRRADGQRSAE